MRRSVARTVAALAFALLFWPGGARAGERVDVLLPDERNLQFLAFWVAEGAGLFAEEGIEIVRLVPPSPALTGPWMRDRHPAAVVLPPPVALELLASRAPVVLGVSLLKNEPILLLAAPRVVPQEALRGATVHDKLARLVGKRIGVAPQPRSRLANLLTNEGFDVAAFTVVVLAGPEQNDALHAGRVDALFAHTPYAERAIQRDQAVVVVDGPRAESPALAIPSVHTLAFDRAFLASHHEAARSMGRAVVRAEALVSADPDRAVRGVLHALPGSDPAEVALLVSLYAPAMPTDARVTEPGVRAFLPLFPANRPAPSLEGVDFANHLDGALGAPIEPAAPRARRGVFVLAALALAAAVGVFFMLRTRARRSPS